MRRPSAPARHHFEPTELQVNQIPVARISREFVREEAFIARLDLAPVSRVRAGDISRMTPDVGIDARVGRETKSSGRQFDPKVGIFALTERFGKLHGSDFLAA